MAETPSTMVALGTALPAFSLPDLDGRIVNDRDFADATALVVAFICPHCPYVKHIRAEFAQVAKEYRARNVAVVAINSNDAQAFPEDDPEGMTREAAAEAGRLLFGATPVRFPLEVTAVRCYADARATDRLPEGTGTPG